VTDSGNRGVRGWIAILLAGLAVISLLLAGANRASDNNLHATNWLIAAVSFALISLLFWALEKASVQRKEGYMNSRISRRWSQVGIAALIGYISARFVWDATGNTGTAWSSALVIAIIVYFVSTRYFANSGIGQSDVISIRIATSYHLAVVIEMYDDRVWLRLFSAGSLARPDSFIGNELLAQDAAWQSQDYVMMRDHFMQSDPMRIGPFNGVLTSRQVAA
jgi:hypothetical protein